jgi:hypothetical protein
MDSTIWPSGMSYTEVRNLPVASVQQALNWGPAWFEHHESSRWIDETGCWQLIKSPSGDWHRLRC